MPGLNFDDLDPTEFEQFCFEMLSALDPFHNVDWRKGTPKDASPADGGRDIVALADRTDPDGHRHTETWFFDCKHYSDRGVPPTSFDSLVTWAWAERPDVACVIASGYLTNPAKDWIADFVENNRPPFRLKFWERPALERLTQDKRDLLARFLLSGMRSESDLLAAEQEFYDRVWYTRHLEHLRRLESGDVPPPRLPPLPPGFEAPPDFEATRLTPEQSLRWIGEHAREKRPDLRDAKSDFEIGFWSGKLSALRWVLGDEWDNLDT